MNLRLTQIFIVITVFSSYATYAKANVEQATREIELPTSRDIEKKLTPLPVKKPVIEEEIQIPIRTGPSFFVTKINLSGCESVPSQEFQIITEKYENKELDLEDINNIAKEIEKEYLRKGIIAVCYLPPQDIKDGALTLKIIEARMGELILGEKTKYFNKDMLKFYWDTPSGEILRYDKILQSLNLMNENPDREVRAILHAGKEPGTTDISLEEKTYFPLHPTFSFDREGSVYTGKERTTVGFRHNNLLFLDDIFLSGYMFGREFSGYYFYHKIPFTNFGTSFMYGYSYSKLFPKKELEYFGIESQFRTLSFFLYQNIFKDGNYLGEVYSGLDAEDKKSTIPGGTFNKDRLRVVRVGGNFIHRGFLDGTTFINPEISCGINGLGARKKDALSSRGAANTFSKFNLRVTHQKDLPMDFQSIINLAGQVSTTKLSPQETFYLGGIKSVRGYPAGDFLADNTFLTNIELLIPIPFIPDEIKIPSASKSFKDNVKGIVFFDYAYGMQRGTVPEGDKKHVNMASIGAGIRVKLIDKSFLKFEWGFPVGDKPITESGRSRFHISIDCEL